MFWIERALAKEGFEVFNQSYLSRDHTLDEICETLHKKLEKFEGREKYFVTHSMGALVARNYLHRHKQKNVKRIVMLAPPNRGSCVAKYNESHSILGPTFRKVFGKAAAHLTPAAVEKLPAPECEFGIIAGGRNKTKGYAHFLPGDNDGIVTVEETKLPGMTDFAIVPHLHSFIMNGRDTIRLTIHFLQNGKFKS